MKIRFTLLLFFLFSVAKAQFNTVIPPSPNSSELVKFIDNPVSLYSGSPKISIPIYDLKLRDYSLSIRLDYNSTGIKLDERASNVGLGWSLAAGGVITRAVKGMPDDYYQPNCPGTASDQDCRIGLMWNGRNIKNIDLQSVYNTAMSRKDFYFRTQFMPNFFNVISGIPFAWSASYEAREDVEPDIFYFNFGGKSGKFIFDYSSGTPIIKLIPYQNLKMEYTISNHSIVAFKVTDESGVQYQFEDTEVTQNGVTYNSIDYSQYYVRSFNTKSYNTNFNSSWLLTKIITPLKNIIDFKYVNESYIVRNQTAIESYISGGPKYIFKPVSADVNVISGKRLSSIESPSGKVNFNTSLARSDVMAYNNQPLPGAITAVEIFNSDLRLINKATLSFDYFLSSTEAEPGDFDFVPSLNPDCYKRLRLKGVKFGVDATMNYEFEYKHVDYTGNARDVLPRIFSTKQDLWGYYNGATGNITGIPAIYVYPDMYNDDRQYSIYKKVNYTGREYYFEGANRLPDSNLTDVGMLTKIKYPTGGYTSYNYESHRFKDEANEYLGGGVRIKNIIKNDGIKSQIYSYLYSDNNGTTGKAISVPGFAMLPGVNGPFDKSRDSYWKNLCLYSSPRTGIGTTQGSYIGYSEVTEKMIGLGKTVYRYGLPATWFKSDDLPNQGCSLTEDGYCDGLYSGTKIFTFIDTEGTFTYPATGQQVDTKNESLYQINMFPATLNSFPYAENPDYDWNRGQLISEKVYDEDSHLLQEKNYDYKLFYPKKAISPTKVYGLKFGNFTAAIIGGGSFANIHRIAKYEYLTDVAKVPSRVIETSYYNTDLSKKSIKITEYKYNGFEHLNLNESRFVNSTGDSIITSFKYPQDYITSNNGTSFYPQVEGVSALLSKNISSIPVETTTSIVKAGIKSVVTSDLTTYKLVNDLALPFTHYKLETSSPLQDFVPPNQNPNAQIGFLKDSRYLPVEEFKNYDEHGGVTMFSIEKGPNTSYIWGYNNQYVIAQIKNASNGEYYFQNFEENTADFDPNLTVQNNRSHTGNSSGLINNTLVTEKTSHSGSYLNVNNTASRLFTYSGWIYSDGPSAELFLFMYKAGETGYYSYIDVTGTSSVGGWTFVTKDFMVPADVVKMRMRVDNNGIGNVWFDDLSIRPTDSQLTTYTFNPLVGMTSKIESNGETFHFEYDDFQRLKAVRDQNQNLIKTSTYHYKN
jgi:hypothetical protein